MSEQGGCNEPSPESAESSSITSPAAVLSEDELRTLNTDELIIRLQQQYAMCGSMEIQVKHQEGELSQVRDALERTRSQMVDVQQREKTLVRRLAAKEQEMQDYVCQVNELKQAQATTRSTLLDPAVNALLQALRHELQSTKSKLEETQNDLSAWKFTPDSNTGKRLMAKCRQLHQENEELGKITSSGRIAILEGDLALQKKFSEEVRQSQLELDSFLADLDEDVEGMQSTILLLQQELRKSKELVAELQKENGTLKSNAASLTAAAAAAAASHNGTACNDTSLKRANGDSNVGSVVVCEDKTDDRTTRVHNNKRVRRSSVLSIDYNDEDINTNGDANVVSD